LLLLGNDIVDLNETGMKGKSKDTRFMQRVFNAEEKSTIVLSNHPDLTLWMFWAAKETTFKLVSKISGPPVFSHKKFQISALQQTTESSFKANAVYQEHSFPIAITFTNNYIHAVGGNLTTDKLLLNTGVHKIAKSEYEIWGNRTVWNDTFTQEELESIHHLESALVRFYCKKSIAETLKTSASHLQIIRPTKGQLPQPPFVLRHNKPCEIDISLSHHGSWLGWCFSSKRK